MANGTRTTCFVGTAGAAGYITVVSPHTKYHGGGVIYPLKTNHRSTIDSLIEAPVCDPTQLLLGRGVLKLVYLLVLVCSKVRLFVGVLLFRFICFVRLAAQCKQLCLLVSSNTPMTTFTDEWWNILG